MRTFKENSYDIVKLFINQIGIAIFSLFLLIAVGAAFENNDTLFGTFKIAVSVFAVIFYAVIVYYMFWEVGAKDAIRVAGGRAEFKPFKATFISAWANIPNLFVSGLCIILLCVYSVSSSEAVLDGFRILFLVCSWLMDMYLGIIQTIAPEAVAEPFAFNSYIVQSVLYFVIPSVVSCAVVNFGYFMGYNEKRIFSISKK